MNVLSLYDKSGIALMPWAEAGFYCYGYDIQHSQCITKNYGKGSITFTFADLYDFSTLKNIINTHKNKTVFLSAFPPCTDLAVSGAAWFKSKAEKDPNFQQKATDHAIACSWVAEQLNVSYYIENPVSVLSTLWRKPDYSFHPYEYGGYLPINDIHPEYPEYIVPRDAYPKKTCLWTDNGFVMPYKLSVSKDSQYSKQHLKLGGKSERTKNIRSQTPRGFSIAVFKANSAIINAVKTYKQIVSI